MVKKTEALKPDYFADVQQLRSLRTEEKAKKDGTDPEESAYHSLQRHDGWKALEKFINEIMLDLDNLTKAQMEKGASREEIGATAVTAQLGKDLLNKILNKVNDATEAVEEKIIEERQKRSAGK